MSTSTAKLSDANASDGASAPNLLSPHISATPSTSKNTSSSSSSLSPPPSSTSSTSTNKTKRSRSSVGEYATSSTPIPDLRSSSSPSPSSSGKVAVITLFIRSLFSFSMWLWYFHSFRQLESDIMFYLQRGRRRLPRTIRSFCDNLISTHPLHDLSFAIWIGTLVALYHIGYPLMWVLSANVFVAFLLSWIVGGHVPSDVDVRLRPRGRVSPSGFPCVELQLASALATVLSMLGANPVIVGLAASSVGVFIVLRLYALTHFPHQLVLSIFLGATSGPILLQFGNRMFPKGLHPQTHLLGAIAVTAVFIGYIAYKAESNDAPIMRIPKDEYLRVIGDIMRGDDATISQNRGAQVQAALAALAAAAKEQSQPQAPKRNVKFASDVAGGLTETEEDRPGETKATSSGSIFGGGGSGAINELRQRAVSLYSSNAFSGGGGAAGGVARLPPAGPQFRGASVLSGGGGGGGVVVGSMAGRRPPAGPQANLGGPVFGFPFNGNMPLDENVLYPASAGYGETAASSKLLLGSSSSSRTSNSNGTTKGTGKPRISKLEDDEDDDDDGDDDGDGGALAKAAVRPARDSFYYLMKSMEK